MNIAAAVWRGERGGSSIEGLRGALTGDLMPLQQCWEGSEAAAVLKLKRFEGC